MRVAIVRWRKGHLRQPGIAGVAAPVPMLSFELRETQPLAGVPSPSRSTLPAPQDESDGSDGAELLRRAPGGYLWNQAYSFLTFFALFLHNLVITNALSTDEKGVYGLIERPAVFAVYLAALGLDTAATTYLPRAFAEGGRTRALGVALRLILLRVLGVLVVAGVVLVGLSGLAALLTQWNLPGGDALTAIVNDPRALAHLGAIAGYVVAVGLVNILGSLLTALLRTRTIFIFGGTAQALTIAFAWALVVELHLEADGALWALTIPNALMALVFGVVLFRTLGLRPAAIGEGVTLGMLRLGGAAWASDLANGSLVPLVAQTQLIALVALAGVSYSQKTAVGYFITAYQLGDGATFLLVNGLGGVGLAVLSAAYVGRIHAHLAIAWRTISKIQVLLGVPLLAFIIPHADGIISVLYHDPYAPVGVMLGGYLVLSAITRLAGGGAHSAVLYVLGKARWVVFASWLALVVIAGLDLLLIPRLGVLGALIAVGVAKIVAELLQLVVAQRALGRPYPVAFMLRVLLALVPGVAFAYLWRPSSFVTLFVAGLGFAALFLGSLLVIRPLDAEDGGLLDQVSSPLRTLLLPLVARGRGNGIPASLGD